MQNWDDFVHRAFETHWITIYFGQARNIFVMKYNIFFFHIYKFIIIYIEEKKLFITTSNIIILYYTKKYCYNQSLLLTLVIYFFCQKTSGIGQSCGVGVVEEGGWVGVEWWVGCWVCVFFDVCFCFCLRGAWVACGLCVWFGKGEVRWVVKRRRWQRETLVFVFVFIS